jgi:hypothetical protein
MATSKSKKTRRLRDMVIGEVGYTAPWSLKIMSDDSCCIDEDFPVYNEPFGSIRLKVVREEAGYVAHTSICNYHWEKSEINPQPDDAKAISDAKIALQAKLAKAINEEDFELAAKIYTEIQNHS